MVSLTVLYRPRPFSSELNLHKSWGTNLAYLGLNGPGDKSLSYVSTIGY